MKNLSKFLVGFILMSLSIMTVTSPATASPTPPTPFSSVGIRHGVVEPESNIKTSLPNSPQYKLFPTEDKITQCATCTDVVRTQRATDWGKIARVARSQIGYTANYQNWSKYGAWYGNGNPTFSNGAWCAMFVSWVYAASGYPVRIQTSKGFAHVWTGFDILRRQGRVTGVDRAAFMNAASFRSPEGHTGLLHSYKYVYMYPHVISIDGNIWDNRAGRNRVKYVERDYRSIIEVGHLR